MSISAKEAVGERPTKLKRKDPLRTESPKIVAPPLFNNIYEKVNEYEEKEAFIQDGDKDEILYLEICKQFSNIIKEVTEMKVKYDYESISEKRIDGSLLFVMLKKLNRLEKFRLNKNREQLNETKRQVDHSHLQLENLLYEIDHLKQEVSKCLQFSSKDESIELVPVDQFYKEAPETITRSDITKNDSHQLRLARLEWELEQRKVIAETCHELEVEKQHVATAIQKKQIRISNLAPMIKKILNVTKPVQEYLCLPMSQIQLEPELSNLLPHPLYFLSLQVDALREACDPLLKVKILGNKEECESFKTVAVETPLEEDSDSEGEDNKTRHRKKSYAQVQEEKVKHLFTKHPLSVEVTVSLKDKRSISIVFAYFVNLQIVTTISEVYLPKPFTGSCCKYLLDSFSVLNALFPDDFGDLSPNLANHYQFQQLGVELNKADHGIPYVWAQRLCGLSFPNNTERNTGCNFSKNISIQKSAISTIKAIRKRLETRLDLCFQMNEIERSLLPVEFSMFISYMQVKANASFSKWEQLSWETYQTLPYVRDFICQQYVVTSHDMFYLATITRNSCQLVVAIALKPEYPSSPPVYALQLKYDNVIKDASNDDHIRDIERELNVYYKEVSNRLDKPLYLLTAQLHQILVSFDIYLECKHADKYPREKLFFHYFRGRTRSLPLKHVHQVNEGVFVQR